MCPGESSLLWRAAQVWRAFYTVYLDVWNFRTLGGTRIDRCSRGAMP